MYKIARTYNNLKNVEIFPKNGFFIKLNQK